MLLSVGYGLFDCHWLFFRVASSQIAQVATFNPKWVKQLCYGTRRLMLICSHRALTSWYAVCCRPITTHRRVTIGCQYNCGVFYNMLEEWLRTGRFKPCNREQWFRSLAWCGPNRPDVVTGRGTTNGYLPPKQSFITTLHTVTNVVRICKWCRETSVIWHDQNTLVHGFWLGTSQPLLVFVWPLITNETARFSSSTVKGKR